MSSPGAARHPLKWAWGGVSMPVEAPIAAQEILNVCDPQKRVLKLPRKTGTRARPLPLLRYPEKKSLLHPGGYRQRPARGLHRLPRAALDRARTGQRRHPLFSRGLARRSPRARRVDDVEMRGRRHSLRRRKRRRDCDPSKMSKSELERVTRRYTAALSDGSVPSAMSPLPTSAPRADHGLDDGHVLEPRAQPLRPASPASRSRLAARSDAAKLRARASRSGSPRPTSRTWASRRRTPPWSSRASATSARRRRC